MNTRQSLTIILFIFPFMGWAETVVNPPSHSGVINPCMEGEFLDLYKNQCNDLDNNFGFSFKEFNDSYKDLVINISDCNEISIHNAIEKVKSNGGGTVNLAACTYNVTKTIYVPSNTVFQGMGAEKTILKHKLGYRLRGSVIQLSKYDKIQNVILRDLKIQGQKKVNEDDRTTRNIQAQYAKNLLVERVELADANHSGIHTPNSQQITVRYSHIYDALYNGVGTADCSVKISLDKNDDGVVDKKECSGDTTQFWSENYAVYSNISTGHGNNGLEIRSSLTEVAGNNIENNRYGMKIFYPASNVWVHDNSISKNKDRTSILTGFCDIIDKSMQVQNIALYRNQFIGNSIFKQTFGFSAAAAKNVVMIDNIYLNNGKDNTWNIHSSCKNTNPIKVLKTSVNICANDEFLDNNYVGNGTLTKISSDKCDLSNVANIFGLFGDLNGDGVVNLEDINNLEDYYGKNYSSIADLNNDGFVNGTDSDLIYQFIDRDDKAINLENVSEPVITVTEPVITRQQLFQQIEKLHQEQIELLALAQQISK